jgi:hypothetical protein
MHVRGSTPNKPGRNGRIREGDYYINTRSWFIDQVVAGDQDIFNLVEHLAHEWSHKFGFIDTGLEEVREISIIFICFWQVGRGISEKSSSRLPNRVKTFCSQKRYSFILQGEVNASETKIEFGSL